MAFGLNIMHECGLNASLSTAKEGMAVLDVNIAAKGVLCAVYY